VQRKAVEHKAVEHEVVQRNAVQHPAKPRRADDLAEARLIGEEYGLSTVDEVIREWGDRSGLIHVADFLFGGAILWGIFGTLFIVLPSGPGSVKAAFGAFIGGLIVLGSLLMVLGERFKAVRCRYFVYSGGIAQLVRRPPELRVLRWADVETVTITAKKDDDGNLETDVGTCAVAGPGTEITAGPESEVFAETPGRTVAAAAHKHLAPRLVPALIEACQSGELVTAGPISIDEEGITLTGARYPWSEITSMAVTYDSRAEWAPITRIDFRTAGMSRDYELFLADIPNGIFLADLIAHAASGHGLDVRDYRRP
jgi:hypothetical protein